jgi:mono/diheme cytochrome c family protein
VLVASGITTLGKTVLLVVAGTFIVWSLYTALVVPKRRPGFPKRLDVYILLSAVLFAAQMGAVVWVTGTQEIEEESHAADTPTETTPTETTPTETTPAETLPAVVGDPEEGSAVFASAGCGSCHVLADAGSAGAVGPNLDELAPTEEQVSTIVTNGRGAMPAFSDQLSEEEIADVAAYVSSVAGA